jgi:ATP-dependent DNA ligase
MPLPLSPPLAPQLARAARELPVGERWCYEPKYDGFRAIAFVDGETLALQSRGERPLARYFPELRLPAMRCVLDGEIVIDDPSDDSGARQDFEALQNRIHPAASRIELLSRSTPARYIAFDLLAFEDDVLLARPFAERRAALERLLTERQAVPDGPPAAPGGRRPPLWLAPHTRDPDAAAPWLCRGEGVVAKDLLAPYRPGERVGMVKVKRQRTIEAVVAGYRPGKEPGTVGSLILGLYDEHGDLRVVGHCSGLRGAQRRALRERLAAYESGQRGRGDPSRWRSERELEWVSLRPELVVEVSFDHVSGGRIRHGTRLVRWRTDKAPEQCLLAQLAEG